MESELTFFQIFDPNFGCVPNQIWEKEKYFQISVFHEDFKNGLKIKIGSFWKFDLP